MQSAFRGSPFIQVISCDRALQTLFANNQLFVKGQILDSIVSQTSLSSFFFLLGFSTIKIRLGRIFSDLPIIEYFLSVLRMIFKIAGLKQGTTDRQSGKTSINNFTRYVHTQRARATLRVINVSPFVTLIVVS